MLHLLEVLAPITRQHGSIELGITADIVIVAGIEACAARLVPGLVGPEIAALKDGALIGILRPVLDRPASLQNRDPGAGRCQSGSDCGAAYPRSNNDDV